MTAIQTFPPSFLQIIKLNHTSVFLDKKILKLEIFGEILQQICDGLSSPFKISPTSSRIKLEWAKENCSTVSIFVHCKFGKPPFTNYLNYIRGIPDICHQHHQRCWCQNFQAGVKKMWINVFWCENHEFCVFFVSKSLELVCFWCQLKMLLVSKNDKYHVCKDHPVGQLTNLQVSFKLGIFAQSHWS